METGKEVAQKKEKEEKKFIQKDIQNIKFFPVGIVPFEKLRLYIKNPDNNSLFNPKKEKSKNSKMKQEQIHELLFSRRAGWQEIIYDLINTEQIDPWDVDIIVLTEKYLEKISKLDEADFYISSKVLLAAALLLKIKSEVLLDKYIKDIDEILFGKKKDSKEKKQERIELDEEIPEIIPRSPMPRRKKVTLNELVDSLDKAIKTENRRIKKAISYKNALRESSVSKPKRKKSVTDRINEIYNKLNNHFQITEDKTISYTKFVGKDREERIISFFPLLHLENQKKIWLEQEKHFEEIFIWLKETFLKYNPDPFADLRTEVDELNEEKSNTKKTKQTKKQNKRKKNLEKKFSNPIE